MAASQTGCPANSSISEIGFCSTTLISPAAWPSVWVWPSERAQVSSRPPRRSEGGLGAVLTIVHKISGFYRSTPSRSITHPKCLRETFLSDRPTKSDKNPRTNAAGNSLQAAVISRAAATLPLHRHFGCLGGRGVLDAARAQFDDAIAFAGKREIVRDQDQGRVAIAF